MYNVAVIGDKDSVAGFGTLGLDTYFTDTRDECRKIFKQLASSGKFAVIYITEKASEYVADEIEKYTESILPAVIMIPGVSGNTGSGILGVRKSVEKVVGSDIIFND